MEVEFIWKRIFVIILIIALVAGYFALWQALPTAHMAKKSSSITPTPAPPKVVASDINIRLENQSGWKVEGLDACLPKLNAWLDQYPLESLTVVITDTVSPDMVIGVTQTSENEPKATVFGKYEEIDGQDLNLIVAVKEGEPGDNLDVAMTVETALLVQDHFRPRTKNDWSQNEQEGLEVFQPLIHKENSQWVSDCLHLDR